MSSPQFTAPQWSEDPEVQKAQHQAFHELLQDIALAVRRASTFAGEGFDVEEPPPGSIVVSDGSTGTAWQRFNSDRLWHSTTGRVMSWADLLDNQRRKGRQGVTVVHDTTGMST